MLRFIDGFDHYAIGDLTGKWSAAFTGGSVIGTTYTTRTGAGALAMTQTGGSNYAVAPVGSLATTVILGFGFRLTAAQSGVFFCAIGADTVTTTSGSHVGLYLNSSGTISVYRNGGLGQLVLGQISTGAGVLLGSTATALSVGQWYYLEFKMTLSNTTGTVDLYVNGVSALSLTSQDTQFDAAPAYCNVFGIGGSGTGYFVYDDLYVADGTAGTVTDVLGPQKVATVLPSTGNGTYTDWTPSTGTDHGALVDEATPNGDTDYNASSTVGHRDSYHFPALGVTGLVNGVQATGWIKTDISGARSCNQFTRIGSSDYDGTAAGVDTTYRGHRHVWEDSPATAVAWTIAEIDGAEFGVRVQA